MIREKTFQDFFNNNPAIAGILVFVIIALLVVVVWLIIFFGSKSIKKKKMKEKNVLNDNQIVNSKEIINLNQKTNNIQKKEKLDIQNKIEADEKKQYVFDEKLTYFIVDFNNEGKLILKNMTKKIIHDKPTKQDYYDSMLTPHSRLLLPEKYIELGINQKNSNFFLESSKPVQGRNLYVYNSLKRFLDESDTPWAISKFN